MESHPELFVSGHCIYFELLFDPVSLKSSVFAGFTKALNNYLAVTQRLNTAIATLAQNSPLKDSFMNRLQQVATLR